ncbi:MAG: cytochrome c [Verrucomicrobiae bacterium]|nr:cytochrome c [Verrucomicrobiae bacterium]
MFAADQALSPLPVAVASTHCENVFQVTPRLYSGSQPEGDAGFEELARLGVKTVVSVDGSAPDLEAARRHGMRYVHLPFGYGGIPTNRIVELARAVESLPGPIYVHCHHGQHRGPAAVAVMCLAGEGWTAERGEAWLRLAGTSADYPGLYEAVRTFQKPDPAAVSAAGSLPELAPPSTVVGAMVAMDGHLDGLKAARKHRWKTPPEHPDLRPGPEAVLLWEQLKELGRHPDTAARPDGYRERLSASEAAADRLRTALTGPWTEEASASADAAFTSLVSTCSACHKAFRN